MWRSLLSEETTCQQGLCVEFKSTLTLTLTLVQCSIHDTTMPLVLGTDLVATSHHWCDLHKHDTINYYQLLYLNVKI